MAETVNYRAKSAWIDPVVIISISIASLTHPAVQAVIPENALPIVTAALAILNIIIQVVPRAADNPVRLNIVPGYSKPVTVKKLD